MLTKERQTCCNLQVKLCDPCLSALGVWCLLKKCHINALLSFFLFSMMLSAHPLYGHPTLLSLSIIPETSMWSFSYCSFCRDWTATVATISCCFFFASLHLLYMHTVILHVLICLLTFRRSLIHIQLCFLCNRFLVNFFQSVFLCFHLLIITTSWYCAYTVIPPRLSAVALLISLLHWHVLCLEV